MKVKNNLKWVGSGMGLYDNNHPQGKSVKAEKVIDITDFCKGSEQVVVKYARVTRGLIAQICDQYTKGKDLGVTLHYHINEHTPDTLAKDIVFEGRASDMGIDSNILAQLIYENQPA